MSIRTICDKIPCNVSAISYHFGSKEGLYRECFRVEGQDIIDLIEKILTAPLSQEDFKAMLKLFFSQFFEHSFKNREIILIIGKDVGSKSAMESMEKLFSDIPAGIMNFLQMAQDRSLIRKDIDLFFLCSCLLDPIFMQILFLEQSKPKKNFTDPEVRKSFIEQHLSFYFSGVF